MSRAGKTSVADSMCGLKRLIENSEDKFVTLHVNAYARPINFLVVVLRSVACLSYVFGELQATEGDLAHAHL